ncbi:hypothetical protein B7C51_19160 [Paenibacillus larvae subsp. pulvifaciens]|uniref:Uncharacterized protein n=1 Tax=Paenibacillus larvae subsp. pulvifaciens TaxID=1477 RepID=A0A1V0UWF1_9BACL|nr:hypothetical protein [Paenibacillus larvae]ARF69479.1 hypothetical protein B7C51_19160 [Paenibacillus larvae subsp. pulvifaciens]
MQSGDLFVTLLVVTVIVSWLTLRFRRWLDVPVKQNMPIPLAKEPVPEDEVVELLEGAGFNVLSGKMKVPILITVNDTEDLQSRLYLDYFAEKKDKLYVVKKARQRKPMELTGTSVRDTLLIYQLLYPETDGVLYVDMNQLKIKKITFQLEVQE